MLLMAYFVSILICLEFNIISIVSVIKKLEKEGINKLLSIKSISNLNLISILDLIPGINIIRGISLLNNRDKIYETIKNKVIVPELKPTSEENTEKPNVDKTIEDDFLLDIATKMKLVASCQYTGYEQDLVALCSLANKYFEVKSKKGAAKCNEILIEFPSFLRILVEIESRIDGCIKRQEFQTQDLATLEQIQNYLDSIGVIHDNMSYEELLALTSMEETNLTFPGESFPNL